MTETETHNDIYHWNVAVPCAVAIQKARGELEQIETPWEPFRELAGPIADGSGVDGYLWIFVPWTLMPTLLKCVEHAKNTSSSSRSWDLVNHTHRLQMAIERRPAIERMGDLVR